MFNFSRKSKHRFVSPGTVDVGESILMQQQTGCYISFLGGNKKYPLFHICHRNTKYPKMAVAFYNRSLCYEFC